MAAFDVVADETSVIWFSLFEDDDDAVVVIVNGVVTAKLIGLILLALIDCGNAIGCDDAAGDKRVGVGVCHP